MVENGTEPASALGNVEVMAQGSSAQDIVCAAGVGDVAPALPGATLSSFVDDKDEEEEGDRSDRDEGEEDAEMLDLEEPFEKEHTAQTSTFSSHPGLGDSFRESRLPTEPNVATAAQGITMEERERKIKEIRRRLRARESGDFIPHRRSADGTPVEMLFHSSGRPSRRRSLSTGDAEDFTSPVSV